MPLLARTVHTPLAIEVRPGAVAQLGTILADRRISGGGEVAVVVGPGQGETIADLLRKQLDAADFFPVTGGTLHAAQELADKLRERSYDAVVGIGGGKTLDTAKWAAARYGIPMVSVATSLAHDGLASPVSSLDHNGRRGSYGVQIPIAVVVDLDFVASSPDGQTRSGVGDALSNLSACADWELAHRVRDEPIDGLAVTLARTGAEALLHHPGTLADPSLLATLAEALILAGIAMSVCGTSRPCSGGCHEISHALDELHLDRASHGEQVGVGALFCTWLRGELDRFADMATCLSRHGLPVRPSELGVTEAEFAEAVALAPRTRPDRFTILEHLDLDLAELTRRVADYVGAVDEFTSA